MSYKVGDHVQYNDKEWVVGSIRINGYTLVSPKKNDVRDENTIPYVSDLYLSPWVNEPKFQVGDKVQTPVGEVVEVDRAGNVRVKFPTVPNRYFPNNVFLHSLTVNLVERPKPKKEPGTFWKSNVTGDVMIFLKHSEDREMETYWHIKMGQLSFHSKAYASNFVEA
jgi:hypothetical protein